MLDHPIVDAALRLILLYSTLSLVASVVKEWVSSVFALRAKNLQHGIQNLIGETHAAHLYGHPLVSTLAKEKKLPSYIGSGTFASVLVDMLGQDENGKSVVAARDKAAALVDSAGDDPVLGPVFRALSNVGAETVADLRREIANWFDEGMNRVSGWYTRKARLIISYYITIVVDGGNAGDPTRRHRPVITDAYTGNRWSKGSYSHDLLSFYRGSRSVHCRTDVNLDSRNKPGTRPDPTMVRVRELC